MNAGSIEFLTDSSPLKRVADPADIAELVSYLAGPFVLHDRREPYDRRRSDPLNALAATRSRVPS